MLCLAFPLQPPRRAGAAAAPNRLAELDAVTVSTLVVQGARDAFGMPPAAELRTVEVVADHGLKTDLEAVAAAVPAWLRRPPNSPRRVWLGVTRQPVVGQRLPDGGVRRELVPLRPDARIAVDRPEPTPA